MAQHRINEPTTSEIAAAPADVAALLAEVERLKQVNAELMNHMRTLSDMQKTAIDELRELLKEDEHVE